MSEAMARLCVSPIAIWLLTRLLMPTEAMVPSSKDMMSPSTALGMVLRIAPLTPTHGSGQT